MKASIRVVGKRQPARGGVAQTDAMLRLVLELRRGQQFIPRGVFRFRTHEEKDRWTLKMLSR